MVVFTALKRARYRIELHDCPGRGREEAEMAEEQELLLSERVIMTLPTHHFSSRGWSYISQDGSRRPGIEVFMLMELPSGKSVDIKATFWGTGSPQNIVFFLSSPVKVRVNYQGNNPWHFFEEVWRLHAALRC